VVLEENAWVGRRVLGVALNFGVVLGRESVSSFPILPLVLGEITPCTLCGRGMSLTFMSFFWQPVMVDGERFVRFSVDGAVIPTVRLLIVRSIISSMILFYFVFECNSEMPCYINTPSTVSG
jgi:hypothetical protein